MREPVMRVLMTCDMVGGVWTYALELARALAAEGVEIVLAAMGDAIPQAARREVARLSNVELFVGPFALEWMSDPWRDVDIAGDWLLAIAAKTRPDVVHVNGYAHAALPFAAPVISVAHSCVVTRHRAVHGCDAPPRWDEYRRRVARGLRAADFVVGPTAAILRDVLAAHRIDAPSRVIANGRSGAEWRPGKKEPFVLAAGHLWDDAKGLTELAACAPRVAWPICVAGSAARPDGTAMSTAGVSYLGELDPCALAAWASRASIYALPARYEPFGLSILDAALSGCALVIGDIPSLREVWGNAATYVPPGDPDALAAAIGSLADAPERRKTFGIAARTRALAFSPATMARRYRELYDELCARDRKAVSA
ncbi:MAG TPA: glycosyltransferase family 4 protein [Kofleriaceae bacterium]|jgi:glycosyltransferase involved in cell wall biosynthesis